MQPRLRFYHSMAALPRPRGYVGKFLLIAFLGVHVPLIALLLYVALGAGEWGEALPVLGVALVATLVGTGLTLWLQSRLLAPMLLTAEALERYREARTVPELPIDYEDEAGVLMGSAQACVTELDRLMSFRTDLLHMLAHDLRGMVTSSKLASDIVDEDLRGGEPDLRELAELNAIIAESCRRQQDLIANVVGLSRQDAGRLQVRREPVAVAELVGGAVRLAQVRAERKGVRIRHEAADAGVVDLDRGMVEQILQNLLDNALKFTPAGGRIVVTAQREDGRLWLDVEDTGIGMPPSIRAELFRPFTPAHRSGTESEGGSGLGLWICRTLAKAQDGRLEVESEEGRGSRFRLVLPS